MVEFLNVSAFKNGVSHESEALPSPALAVSDGPSLYLSPPNLFIFTITNFHAIQYFGPKCRFRSTNAFNLYRCHLYLPLTLM